jgi:hypothetical protein
MSPGIAALGRRYSPCVPELNDVAIVLLRIETIVFVFVEAAAPGHGIAAAGEIGDGLLAVFVVSRVLPFHATAIRQECVAGLPRYL